MSTWFQVNFIFVTDVQLIIKADIASNYYSDDYMVISNTAYSKLRMWCHHKWVEFSSHRNYLIPAATTQNYFRVSVVGNWQSICKNCCDHGVIDPTRTCATSYPSLFVLGSTDLLSTCLAVVADHIYLYKSGSLSVFPLYLSLQHRSRHIFTGLFESSSFHSIGRHQIQVPSNSQILSQAAESVREELIRIIYHLHQSYLETQNVNFESLFLILLLGKHFIKKSF